MQCVAVCCMTRVFLCLFTRRAGKTWVRDFDKYASDNYKIQKIGTKFNVLRGSISTHVSFPGRKCGLFETYKTCDLKSGTTTSDPPTECCC